MQTGLSEHRSKWLLNIFPDGMIYRTARNKTEQNWELFRVKQVEKARTSPPLPPNPSRTSSPDSLQL